MWRFGRLAALAALLGGCVVLAGGTLASASTITITSPTDGASYAAPYAGPVDITWDTAGTYQTQITGPSYSWSEQATYTQGQQTSDTPTTMTTPGAYTLTVTDVNAAQVVATVNFTVTGSDQATITAPASGATLTGNPWQGTARVRWDAIGHPQATYSLTVDGATKCSWAGSNLANGQTTSCALSLAPGTHTLRAVNASTATQLDAVSDRVVKPLPPLAFSGSSVAPAIFYPLVRDGFRDTTTYTVSTNRPARLSAVVTTTRGVPIRSAKLGTLPAGRHVWAWGGVLQNGHRAAPGFYYIHITGTAGGRTVKSHARKVWVRTVVVTHHGSQFLAGDQSQSRAHSGNCYVTPHAWYSHDLFLDCWGGRYARAAYWFTVPAQIHGTYHITGVQHCCADLGGRITSRSTYNGGRYVRILITVTGWRSYDIRNVTIHFTWKRRL